MEQYLMAAPSRQSREWDAAEDFLRKCGLDPTPDAIAQLADAFLPALGIMCGRNPDGTGRTIYDIEGKTWRAEGWRGMLWKMADKYGRIWFFGWKRGLFHLDSALDLLNYTGYYVRLAHRGKAWGKRGKPGKVK